MVKRRFVSFFFVTNIEICEKFIALIQACLDSFDTLKFSRRKNFNFSCDPTSGSWKDLNYQSILRLSVIREFYFFLYHTFSKYNMWLYPLRFVGVLLTADTTATRNHKSFVIF
jgi:hypothetical protein